ncbi:hypothetical protein EVAR_74410_1 [Eumeta japonica]|uniref:Uncharacterized protein n=1 Tax=Eumeta variegata TaxID=151549 RepID=A0A4C1SG83_EUMVA|nr:hypothetical protein EVAR_74410_1 [Eumeta japonica]
MRFDGHTASRYRSISSTDIVVTELCRQHVGRPASEPSPANSCRWCSFNRYSVYGKLTRDRSRYLCRDDLKKGPDDFDESPYFDKGFLFVCPRVNSKAAQPGRLLGYLLSAAINDVCDVMRNGIGRSEQKNELTPTQ